MKDRVRPDGKEITPAAPAKYIDSTTQNYAADGNPKFAEMEARLIAHALAFKMYGMEKFLDWRDGKGFGENVNPPFWYFENLRPGQTVVQARQRWLNLFHPEDYTRMFAPEKKKVIDGLSKNIETESKRPVSTRPAKKKGHSGATKIPSRRRGSVNSGS